MGKRLHVIHAESNDLLRFLQLQRFLMQSRLEKVKSSKVKSSNLTSPRPTEFQFFMPSFLLLQSGTLIPPQSLRHGDEAVLWRKEPTRWTSCGSAKKKVSISTLPSVPSTLSYQRLRVHDAKYPLEPITWASIAKTAVCTGDQVMTWLSPGSLCILPQDHDSSSISSAALQRGPVFRDMICYYLTAVVSLGAHWPKIGASQIMISSGMQHQPRPRR